MKETVPYGPIHDFLQSHYEGVHNKFLVHIDRAHVSVKRQASRDMTVCYSILAGVIAWRAFQASSQLIPLLFSNSPFDDQPLGLAYLRSWWKQRSLLFNLLNLLVDYYCFFQLWPHVRNYFTGHVWMRMKYGFREAEIVFRKPTPLAKRQMWANSTDGGASVETEDRYAQQVGLLTAQALDERFISTRAGIWTGTELWEVDHGMICDAYEAMYAQQIPMETWEASLWYIDAIENPGRWGVAHFWKGKDPNFAIAYHAALKAGMEEMGRPDLHAEWVKKVAEAGPTGPLPTTIAEELFAREGMSFQEFAVKILEKTHSS